MNTCRNLNSCTQSKKCCSGVTRMGFFHRYKIVLVEYVYNDRNLFVDLSLLQYWEHVNDRILTKQ